MPSSPTRGRNIEQHAPISKIDEHEFKILFSACLQEDYGNLKSVAKAVANDADASPETAKTWMEGVSCPGFYRGLKLAAKSPSLAKEVVRLIAAEAELSPEFQEQFAKFMQMVGR